MNGSKYNVVKELGRGSFGSVFLVTHKETGDKFAIKVVENYNPTTTSAEVAIIKTTNHKHIIKYVDSFYSLGGFVIVLEFADRGTFEDVIKAGDLRNNEYSIWRCISHLSEALNYLHTLQPNPILHRDLKPANVLGLNEWNKNKSETRVRWKLADFGIAKLLNKDAQGDFYTSTAIGTPIYMAPEVITFFKFK